MYWTGSSSKASWIQGPWLAAAHGATITCVAGRSWTHEVGWQGEALRRAGRRCRACRVGDRVPPGRGRRRGARRRQGGLSEGQAVRRRPDDAGGPGVPGQIFRLSSRRRWTRSSCASATGLRHPADGGAVRLDDAALAAGQVAAGQGAGARGPSVRAEWPLRSGPTTVGGESVQCRGRSSARTGRTGSAAARSASAARSRTASRYEGNVVR